MPGVAHAAVPGLGGALVLASLKREILILDSSLNKGESHLQSDVSVPPLPDLLVREVPRVLVGHLGPNGGAGVVGVFLSDAAQSVQTQGHLRSEGKLSGKRF